MRKGVAIFLGWTYYVNVITKIIFKEDIDTKKDVNIKKDCDDLSATFQSFKSDKHKYPAKKSLNKKRCLVFGDGEFQFSKECGLKFAKSNDFEEYAVSSHIPYVEKRSYTYDLNGERKSSLIWGVYCSDADEIQSDMGEIQSDRYLSNHLPHEVIVCSIKYFKYFLQSQAANAPLIKFYSYTGFIPKKFEYVHSGGIISKKVNHSSCSNLPKSKKT